jgi:hypothetical protein
MKLSACYEAGEHPTKLVLRVWSGSSGAGAPDRDYGYDRCWKFEADSRSMCELEGVGC